MREAIDEAVSFGGKFRITSEIPEHVSATSVVLRGPQGHMHMSMSAYIYIYIYTYVSVVQHGRRVPRGLRNGSCSALGAFPWLWACPGAMGSRAAHPSPTPRLGVAALQPTPTLQRARGNMQLTAAYMQRRHVWLLIPWCADGCI